MNFDGVREEQVHALLMLVVLDVILFAALVVKVQTEFAVSGGCLWT